MPDPTLSSIATVIKDELHQALRDTLPPDSAALAPTEYRHETTYAEALKRPAASMTLFVRAPPTVSLQSTQPIPYYEDSVKGSKSFKEMLRSSSSWEEYSLVKLVTPAHNPMMSLIANMDTIAPEMDAVGALNANHACSQLSVLYHVDDWLDICNCTSSVNGWTEA
ncbi:hypothetical protein HPB52_021722 [Rhipicephalus sanguineus]|uniref:Uncharacterized protein n=1 Tax=Rhipicephalus sanguineus TaxID=34632 RepID=A0A9D4Q8D9_RHISA|nr:hypothetical protein HPB52_021722 [Rhipicephalus sanguineus]